MGIPGVQTAKALLEFATSSYRTYVLNDASIVSKARFYMLNNQLNSLNQFEIQKILPVQINPTSIQGANSFPRPAQISGAGDPSDAAIHRLFSVYPDIDDEKLSHEIKIDLRYNIYDEYKAATMDGMLGAASSLSLEDKDTTSLYYLKNCVPQCTLFLGGDIQIFGVITEVDYTYESFSRWGNPLSASATVTITEQPTGVDPTETKPLDSGRLSSAAQLGIKGFVAAEAITNTAALVASAALR